MSRVDEILGQSRAVGLLQSVLASERIHHAFVFHGPVGVGKFTTAIAFAKILLCHQSKIDRAAAIRACGTCTSCRLVRHGSGSSALVSEHPDLHVITKELARYNDDRKIRERKLLTIPVKVLQSALIKPVYCAARLCHHKVFVVDEAELLDLRGQNILLKTLEEPPAGTFIILVTSAQEKLLPTMSSRCLRIAFVPLSDACLSSWLDQCAGRLSREQRYWLTSFAAGSLGRAQLAMDYDLDTWAQVVLPAIDQMTQSSFPVELGKTMAGMVDAFAKRWVEAHDGASKEASNKQAARLMWSLISQYARQRLVALARGADQGPEQSEGILKPWLSVIDGLSQAEAEVAANVNLGLVCDHLVSMLYQAFHGGRP